MPEYKLTYFNYRGRAEYARILFAVKGVQYEDIRIEVADWPKIKPTTLTGQLPYMTVDGGYLIQSVAIARYLAREFGYDGNTSWEKARADMIVDSLEDTVKPMLKSFDMKTEAEKDELRKTYTEEKLPGFMKIYEQWLGENEGPYFVGTEMTWADIAVMSTIQSLTNKYFNITIPMDNYPRLGAFMEHMENLPDIAAYLKGRPDSNI